MPTYDYACAACGHRFERFEPIGDDGPKECPHCRKKKARRLLGTGAGLIFKGSGFYTTDYRKTSKGDADASSKETPKKDEPAKKEKKKEDKEPKK